MGFSKAAFNGPARNLFRSLKCSKSKFELFSARLRRAGSSVPGRCRSSSPLEVDRL